VGDRENVFDLLAEPEFVAELPPQRKRTPGRADFIRNQVLPSLLARPNEWAVVMRTPDKNTAISLRSSFAKGTYGRQWESTVRSEAPDSHVLYVRHVVRAR